MIIHRNVNLKESVNVNNLYDHLNIFQIIYLNFHINVNLNNHTNVHQIVSVHMNVIMNIYLIFI